MGFWDVALGDLAAIGVRFSPAEQQVLEEGGEVLFIRGLLSPWACMGDATGILDQFGQRVYVPQFLSAFPPKAKALPGWNLDGQSVSALVDSEVGDYWRQWPAYLGVVSERCVDRQAFGDGIAYVRIWDGKPLTCPGDRELAERLFTAASDRINNSAYHQFVVLSEYEASGYAVDELYPVITGEVDVADLVDLDRDRDYLESMATAYRDLLDGGYLSRSSDPADHQNLKEVSFEPMEDLLDDDLEAVQVWDRMVNRRENALAIIHTALSIRSAANFECLESEIL